MRHDKQNQKLKTSLSVIARTNRSRSSCVVSRLGLVVGPGDLLMTQPDHFRFCAPARRDVNTIATKENPSEA